MKTYVNEKNVEVISYNSYLPKQCSHSIQYTLHPLFLTPFFNNFFESWKKGGSFSPFSQKFSKMFPKITYIWKSFEKLKKKW